MMSSSSSSKPSGIRQPTLTGQAGGVAQGSGQTGAAPPHPPVISRIPSSSAIKRKPPSSVDGREGASALDTTIISAEPVNIAEYKIGDVVYVNGDSSKRGKVCFIGEVAFAKGEFVGIALDTPTGNHDGEVKGNRYFTCQNMHGLFTKASRITKEPTTSSLASSSVETPLRQAKTSLAPLFTREDSSLTRDSPFSPPSSSLATPGSLNVGERVIVTSAMGGSKMGVLRYSGPTDFAVGQWCGVELDKNYPGKNDGSVNGKRYFLCEDNRGLFVPASKVSSSPSNRQLRRHGSRESLVSMSSFSSSVTSRSPRKVNSRGPQCLPTCSLQAVLKEKENHVEHLIKEREMDRVEVLNISSKCEELSQEIRSLKAEIVNKNEIINNPEAVNKLEAALEEERRKIEDLQYNLDEERIVKADLISQLQAKAAEAPGKDELLQIKAAYEKANQEISKLQEELRSQSQSLYSSESCVKSLRSELLTLKSSDGNKELALSNFDQLLTDYKSQIQDHLQNLENKSEVEIKLQSSIQALQESERNSLQTLLQANNEITSLKSQKLELESEMKSLVNFQELSVEQLTIKIGKSNSDLLEAKNKLETSSKQNLDLNKVIQSLKEEKESTAKLVNDFQCQLEELKKAVEAKTKEVNQLEMKSAENAGEIETRNRREIEQLQQELNTCRIDLQESKEAIKISETQKSQFIESVSLLSSDNKSSLNTIEELKATIEKYQENIQVLEKLLKQQKNETTRINEKLAAENAELSTQCKKYVSELTEKSENLKKSSELCNTLKIAEKESRKEMDRLMTIINEKDLANGAQLKDMQSLKDNILKLKTEVEDEKADKNQKVEECDFIKQSVNKLEEEIKLLNLKCHSLESDVQEKTKAVATLENELKQKSAGGSELEKEVVERGEKIRQLEQDLRDLRLLLSNSQLEYKDQINEVTKLQKDSQTKESQINELVQQNKQKDELCCQLENNLSAMKSKAMCLENDAVKKSKCIAELEGKLQDNLTVASKLEKDLSVQAEQKSEIENNRESLKKQCLELESKLNIVAKENITLKTDLAQLNATKDSVGNDLNLSEKRADEFAKRLETGKNLITKLEIQLKEKLDNINELKSEVNEKNTVIDENNKVALLKDEQFKALECELKTSSDKQTALKLKFQKNLDVIRNLEEEQTKLTSKSDDIEKELTRRANLIDELEASIEKFKAERSELHAQIQEKSKKLSEFQQDLKSKVSGSDALKNELSCKESVIVTLEQEISTLKGNLKDLESANQHKSVGAAGLQKELESITNLYSSVKEEIVQRDQRIQEMKISYETQHQKNSELSKMIQDKAVSIAKLKETLEGANSELVRNEGVTKELKMYQDSVVALEREVVNLKSRLRDFENILNDKCLEIKNLEVKASSEKSNNVDEAGDSSSHEIHVNFLNSIIVDLQNKNKELETKVDVLLNGASQNNQASSATLPAQILRPYCDICEVFDLHDTEDCPTQISSVPDNQHHKRGEVRAYCETCEVFGHWTEDCDDGETF